MNSPRTPASVLFSPPAPAAAYPCINDGAAPRDLRAHFVPWWPKNPYHAQLAHHLAAAGVAVAPSLALREIVPAVRRRDTSTVVHVHAIPAFGWRPRALKRIAMFFFRLLQLRRAGARIVWTVHNACHHESSFPRVDRWIASAFYRRADAVILHSRAARSFVENLWRVRRTGNVFVIPHGHFIDCYPAAPNRAQARARLGVPPDSLVFLHLGNIRPYKGVPRLVREFKHVATSRMRLVIAGDVLSPELRQEIEHEIGGHPQIDFRPAFVPDADVPDYLAAADVVVFPYTQALTSGALVLAMSFGRASIAPRFGALADTLSPHGGFPYDPDSPLALRDALRAAATASAQLHAMGAHNRRQAREWSWDGIGRHTAQVYRAAFDWDA